MGIVANRNFDAYPFFTTGNYPSDGGFWNGNNLGYRQSALYYDRLDVFIADWTLSAPPPASESWFRFDPLLLDNTGTLFDACDEPGNYHIAKGHWNQAGGEQKLYRYSPSATIPATTGFDEVAPLQLNNVLATDVWPNVSHIAPRNGLVAGDPYYWVANGWWLIFETYGKAYNIHAAQWYNASGVLKTDVMIEVDLITGNADVVDVPVAYGTPTHEYTASYLLGQQVDFYWAQFEPDVDDTPARPKGRLWLFSSGTLSPVSSSYYRIWVKQIDFNPTNKEGGVRRIHLRERLLTATDLQRGVPAALDGTHESGTTAQHAWFYHPRSNQLFIVSTQAAGPSVDAGEMKWIFFTPEPAVDKITEPSAQGMIASGKTVPWSVIALGTLNEPIINTDVEFTIQNESTVDEVLNVTPTPGETVTLANTVNPTDPVISPITVKKNGVAMTETTHYTLNRGSSQITFVAPEPVGGASYTATYRHWDDPQNDPHGTLLTSVATSDVDGAATVRVRYDEEDPVADRWDRITATII